VSASLKLLNNSK